MVFPHHDLTIHNFLFRKAYCETRKIKIKKNILITRMSWTILLYLCLINTTYKTITTMRISNKTIGETKRISIIVFI